MNNEIKQLEENEKPFGLMTEEMQAKAKEIGMGEFERFVRTCEWVQCGDKHNFSRVEDSTYRLRADYTEKPEIVRCKVGLGHSSRYDKLLVYVKVALEIGIYQAPADPDFIGFEYEDGTVTSMPRTYSPKITTQGEWKINKRNIDGYEVLTPIAVLFRSNP